MVAQVQRVTDYRKDEQRQRSQREDRRDGDGRVFFIRIDCALRRDDRGHAAYRRADREQRDELW